MTIAISIHAIEDRIYARSALDAAFRGADVPATLDRRHRRALAVLVTEVAAGIIAGLGPVVTATNVAEVSYDSDIITIDCAVDHSDWRVSQLRTNIETAIVCATLARATEGTDTVLSEWYRRLAATASLSLPARIRRG